MEKGHSKRIVIGVFWIANGPGSSPPRGCPTVIPSAAVSRVRARNRNDARFAGGAGRWLRRRALAGDVLLVLPDQHRELAELLQRTSTSPQGRYPATLMLSSESPERCTQQADLPGP